MKKEKHSIEQDILQDYYYIIDEEGYPLTDDDGNTIRFLDYEEAEEFIKYLEVK